MVDAVVLMTKCNQPENVENFIGTLFRMTHDFVVHNHLIGPREHLEVCTLMVTPTPLNIIKKMQKTNTQILKLQNFKFHFLCFH